MIKLTFLGTGAAFTVGAGNYHSNMVLEAENGQRLLIDCGSDARFSLYEQKLTPQDIDAVYISHLHSDHVGGLEWLAFSTRFDPNAHKIKLHTHRDIIGCLWDNVLSGALSWVTGDIVNLSTYFEVHPITDTFEWQGILFKLVKTRHVVANKGVMPSYGLFFKTAHHTVFITTDAQLTGDAFKNEYAQATLIFQDCETASKRSGVHAHYQELVALPEALKKKMWLYHYQPGALPDAVKDGFFGFAKKGQTFQL